MSPAEKVRELRIHLEQALRQWSMYAEFEAERDLANETSAEADMYRAGLRAVELAEEDQ